MIEPLFKPTISFLLLLLSGLVGNAQEQSNKSVPELEPFAGPQLPPSTVHQDAPQKKAALPDQILQLGGNRFLAFADEKVKQLMAADPADSQVRSLKKERCEVAFMEVTARVAEYRSGQAPITNVLQATTRVSSALLALDPDADTRRAILKQNLDIAKELEKYATRKLQNGVGTVQEMAQARYERLTVEIALAEESQSE